MIVQDDRFDATATPTICAMTTDPTGAPLFRLPIDLDPHTQLDHAPRLMVDKLTSVPKASLGEMIGRLSDEDVVRLDRAIVVFLGLA